MKAIKFFVCLLFLTTISAKSQTTYPQDAEEFDLFFELSNDHMEIVITPFSSHPSDILVSNYCYVVSVLIKPTQNNSITIIPSSGGNSTVISGVVSGPINEELGGGGGTTIKSRPIGFGGGRMAQPDYVIFPNPVKDDLIVHRMNKSIKEYSIYDINAQDKSSLTRLNPDGTSINVSNLPKGNYILKIESADSQIITMQFIKN